MATTDVLNVKLTADNADFRTKMSQSGKSLDELAVNAQSASASALGSFTALASGIAALGIGAAIKSSLTFAGDLEQNIGGSEAVFKDYAATIQSTAKTAYSALGLSESKYLATANKMGALFQGSGFSIGKSAEMSAQAMQRASDVASIMGVDVSAAMDAVAGAAKGNFTMMDNLGVAMNDTTLQAYAQEKGLGKLETTQQKVNAAMQMFIDKTDYAAGNYAKENDTYAGSLTTLKAELENTMAELGGALLPLATSVIPIISGAVQTVAPYIKGLAEGISGIGQTIINLNGPALTFAKIAAVSAGAIGAVSLATKAMSVAKMAYGAVLAILTPKVWTFGTALKFAAGWIGIIAGALAVFSMLGSSETTEPVTETAEETSKSADKAADSTDNLADSVEGLGKASKSLAGFDEITKLSGSGGSMASNIATAEDVENIFAANDGMQELTEGISGLGDLTDPLENVINGLVSGEIWNEIDTALTEKFGGIWTNMRDFWGGVFKSAGETIGKIITLFDNGMTQLFGENWTEFKEYWGNVIGLVQDGKFEEAFVKIGTSIVDGWEGIFAGLDNILGTNLSQWYAEVQDFFFGFGSYLYEMANEGQIEMNELSTKYNGLYTDMRDTVISALKSGSTADEAIEIAKSEHLNTNEKLYFFNADDKNWITADNAEQWRNNLLSSGQVNPNEIAPPLTASDVYDANVAANNQSGNGTTRIETTVNLDGETVGKSVTEYQNGQINITNGRQ